MNMELALQSRGRYSKQLTRVQEFSVREDDKNSKHVSSIIRVQTLNIEINLLGPSPKIKSFKTNQGDRIR